VERRPTVIDRRLINIRSMGDQSFQFLGLGLVACQDNGVSRLVTHRVNVGALLHEKVNHFHAVGCLKHVPMWIAGIHVGSGIQEGNGDFAVFLRHGEPQRKNVASAVDGV
jgi:hypothetical protein